MIKLLGCSFLEVAMSAKTGLQTDKTLQNENTLNIGNLTRSLVQQFFPNHAEVKPLSKDQVRQMGSTLLDHTEQIYQRAKFVGTLAANAHDNPARFGCSVFSLGAGALRIFSGDLIGGGIGVGVGAIELYNQCTSGNKSELEELLSDVSADVNMVKILEEGQQQSITAVEENLNFIKKDVTALYDKLDQIKELNLTALQEIGEDQQKAYAKGVAAKEAYAVALTRFSEARNAILSSKESYKKTSEFFVRIQQIADDNDENTPVIKKVEALVEAAKSASEVCSEGKQQLEAADQKFTEAMRALTQASELKDDAIVMITQVVTTADHALQATAEKAEYMKDCSDKIVETQKELQEMKERSQDVMVLLNEMSSELRKAKAEAQKKLDPTDVFVGVGTGIAASSLGPISALAVGVTAAYAWHNGSTIVDTTKKVYNYFFGGSLPQPDSMRPREYVRVSMDQQSSGYYGWLRGRSSQTYGHLDVKLDRNEIVQFRLDLNRHEYPISKEDLLTLYSRMFEKLQDKSLSANTCERILSQLENQTISRGELHPSVDGLIRPSQSANALVKALRKYCEKLNSALPEEILSKNANQALYANIASTHR